MIRSLVLSAVIAIALSSMVAAQDYNPVSVLKGNITVITKTSFPDGHTDFGGLISVKDGSKVLGFSLHCSNFDGYPCWSLGWLSPSCPWGYAHAIADTPDGPIDYEDYYCINGYGKCVAVQYKMEWDELGYIRLGVQSISPSSNCSPKP
jgi:hypothetical protein